MDSCYLEKAVSVLENNVETHSEQVMSTIRNASGGARKQLSAEEVIAPLEMLFEFGELDCAFPCDPTLSPRVFRGDEYSRVDTYDPLYKWREKVLGESSSIVLEASEPSTGMRLVTWYLSRLNSYYYVLVDGPAPFSSAEAKLMTTSLTPRLW